MDIQSLKLRGATGIKKGMGIDEIFVDFRNMEGMIALSGPTGQGKSTILENCQPWPRLVSRPGPALKNHVFLRDSLKELTFVHNGDMWRTVTKIDADSGRTEGFIYINGSQKSENDGKITTYKEFLNREFGSFTLFENSVFCAQNSIKMSSMDPADLKKLFVEFLGKRLETLVHYEDVSKTCSKILLDKIEIIKRDIETQNNIINDLHDVSGTIKDTISERDIYLERKKENLNKIEVTDKELYDLQAKLVKAESDQEKIESLSKDISVIQETLDADIKESLRQIIPLEDELAQNERDISDIECVLKNKDAVEHASKQESMYIKEYDSLKHQLEKAEQELMRTKLEFSKREGLDAAESIKENNELNDLKEKKQSDPDGNAVLLDAKEKANAAACVADAKEIEALRENYRDLRDRHRDATDKVSHIKNEIKNLSNDPRVQNMNMRLDGLRETAKMLDKRGTVTFRQLGPSEPIGPIEFDCNTENCPAVAMALDASKQIPVIESDLKKLIIEIDRQVFELNNDLQRSEEIVSSLVKEMDNNNIYGKEMASIHEHNKTEREAEIHSLREKIRHWQDDIDTEIYDLKELIYSRSENRRTRIEQIKKDIEEEYEVVEDLKSELEAKSVLIQSARELSEKLPEIEKALDKYIVFSEKRDKINAEISKINRKSNASKESLTQKISEIESKITYLKSTIDPDLEIIADNKRNYKKVLTECVSDIDEKIKSLDAEIVRLEEQVKIYEKASAESNRLESYKAEISSEQSLWNYLQVKCSANGLRAMEINSVAPSITHDANLLLEKAFGPSAMMDLRTLDDEGKEVLQMVAIDQDGEQVLVSNRSGGQQVYGVKSMRLAMTMISKQKSGRNFLTAFSDEDDFALDTESAVRFTHLYREFMTQGGFNKGFYISHKPQCVALADYIIELGPGGIQS